MVVSRCPFLVNGVALLDKAEWTGETCSARRRTCQTAGSGAVLRLYRCRRQVCSARRAPAP
jgi:hypothetical protein